MRLMIYPNAAKDKETAGYPYVDLFRDLAAACCRPNHTLFTYGYSFGDDHINRVIGDMLTIPSTHLVIIAYHDPLKRIMGFYDRVGRPAQISLMIGDRLGDLTQLVDWYLRSLPLIAPPSAWRTSSRRVLGPTLPSLHVTHLHRSVTLAAMTMGGRQHDADRL